MSLYARHCKGCRDDHGRLDGKGSFDWLRNLKVDLTGGTIKTGVVGGD
jgi:hypothetical protein